MGSASLANMGFTKRRCITTVFGIVIYVTDVGTDLWVAVQYFEDGRVAWCTLTLLFVLCGLACAQIFSYAWFCDDGGVADSADRAVRADTADSADAVERADKADSADQLSRRSAVVLHLLQLGIFIRYYRLLRKAVRTVWVCSPSVRDDTELHCDLFAKATDLSMLRLFETFLESTPQLILQLYIILDVCITGSFFNIAWSTVDYRRCFRRSLPDVSEMPWGLPTVVYLSYKLLTVSGRVLALSLLVVLHTYYVFALAFVWLLGVIWTYREETDFCTSKHLEKLYRAVVGVILIFTFFNIKGQNSKLQMLVYYVACATQNLLIPVMFFCLEPGAAKSDFFWPVAGVIFTSTILGLLLLCLFYKFLHRKTEAPVADEVDGLRNEGKKDLEAKRRMQAFLQH
ncbi:XK-related protein 9-like [Scleropages formosus]|uniref:XK-related protein n=1 Tax=Scleropages formosus TaxID=113540 RepID=A0A0P7UTX3_SCLFO|nr:XK-related protein 9-like [Scleropages formosus]